MEPSGLEKKSAGAWDSTDAGAYGHAQSVGSARSFGWLADPSDGSMGPSPRVMNSICIYIYTRRDYSQHMLSRNRS
jgi:hypothetical protein